jgi:hypothetical protein
MFIVKPVFRSSMYGCTCVRILISNNYMFLFVLDLYFLILPYYVVATWNL